MNKIAQVVEATEQTATVAFKKHGACGSCSACQLGEENLDKTIAVINLIDAKPGDFVEIEMADGDILHAAFVAYIIPLIAMFIAVALAQLLLKPFIDKSVAEILSAIIGFITVGIVYIFIRRKYESYEQKQRYVSTIVRVLDEDAQHCQISE